MKKKVLIVRVNNFYDYDFVAEHNKIINQYGNVWLLKVGRMIPKSKMEGLKKEQGILVLRTDKKHGGNYYTSRFLDYYYGKPNNNMHFPDYYTQLISSLSYTRNLSFEGTWILIDEIKRMKEEHVASLYLERTGETITSLMEKCSTSFMYAKLVFEEEQNNAENAI